MLMKSTILTLGMTFAGSSVMAQDNTKIDPSLCPMFGAIAKTAMTKRQENVLMSDLITAIEKGLGKDDAMGKLGKAIVIQAYNSPLYVTKEAKDREISDFANKSMAICYGG